MYALQTAAFLCLNLFVARPSQQESKWLEWCDAGCSVIAMETTAYHCLMQHDSQPILLQHTTDISTTECLYHGPSYNASQFVNVSIRNALHDVTENDGDECSGDCLDWNNGCTQCLCTDNNRTLCNAPQSVCSSPLLEPHCQTYAHDMDTYGIAVSLTLWLTVTGGGDSDEIFLPVSMLSELQSIVYEYLSRYTSYPVASSSNISCSIYYPYQFSNFYQFYDRDRLTQNSSSSSNNNRLDLDQLFALVATTSSSDNNDNQSHSSFQTTDVDIADIDTDLLLFSTELLVVDDDDNQTTQTVESVTEFGAHFYNYMPQCAVMFDALSSALQFVTDLRNESRALSANLRAVLDAYLRQHVALLVHTASHDENTSSLYEYMEDVGIDMLYIESIAIHNETNIVRVWLPDEAANDQNDSNAMNDSSLLSAHDEFCVSLNASNYKLQLESMHSFLTDISLPLRTTAAPTSAPTKPSDCWFDSTRIEHNSTWHKDACYSISCFDGTLHIADRYCDAQCYLYNETGGGSDSNFNASLCCAACSDNNDDCPSQLTCDSCLGSQRTCSWNGDHCSAICSGEYCWSYTDGECPSILVIRLQIKGVTMNEYDNARSRVNHALAYTLGITENLIRDYYPTQTPDDAYHIEVKKAISLSGADQARISNILMEDDEYLDRLNAEIRIAFQDVPSMRNRIVITSIEYGGIAGELDSGESDGSSQSINESNTQWITDDASVVLLVCGTVICLTILALCVRYPILSFCCCCVPIATRKKIRNWSRDYGCACCQRFTFGVLYDDDRSELIRRRREQRMRYQTRNAAAGGGGREMQEDMHLNVEQHAHDRHEAKELEHGYGDELAQVESGHKKSKRKKKKKKAKKKKMKKKSNDEVQVPRLYYGHDVDVIQEEEIL